MALWTLTVVSADIEGFTMCTSQSSRSELSELLAGDGFLLTFESPTNAVLFGTELQSTIRSLDKNTRGEGFRIRVAINTGEVNVVDGDFFGDAANIAARIKGVAPAGEVFLSAATYPSMNKPLVQTVPPR
jgi:class 3 adenylate cyclase